MTYAPRSDVPPLRPDRGPRRVLHFVPSPDRKRVGPQADPVPDGCGAPPAEARREQGPENAPGAPKCRPPVKRGAPALHGRHVAILAGVLALSLTAVPALGADPVSGKASWYDYRHREAAAGPALREALGPDWRGQTVVVETNDRAVKVRLTDWCACGPRAGVPTVIDLDREAFAVLAQPSRGIIRVVVTGVRSGHSRPDPGHVKATWAFVPS